MERPQLPLDDVLDLVKTVCGLDLSESTPVAEYEDAEGIRRWILVTDDKRWILLFDVSMATQHDLVAEGIPNRIVIASSPLIALAFDPYYSIYRHEAVYHIVNEALKEFGVKEGEVFVTLASVSTRQNTAMKSIMRTLGWDAADVALEPVGTSASGYTFYMDDNGEWKLPT